MTTTTTERPQPRPHDPRTDDPHGAPRHEPGLTGPVIPVPPTTHPAGDLVHPWVD